MEWILNPLTHYALMALILVLCLSLFLSLKKENSALRRQIAKEHEAVSAVLNSFRTSLGNLQSNLDDQESASSGAAQQPNASLSINLTKRSHVLRMYRRGERAEQIAEALQIPRSEVDLLLKVHRSMLGHPSPETPESARVV
jgi:hypothetical protein